MPSTKDIIDQVESLPVEERALVVDALLQTLNRTDLNVDLKWAEVARCRLEDLRSGRVKSLPGHEVLKRAQKRFKK